MKVIDEVLPEMTQQVWVPRDATDDCIWRKGSSQGIAIPVPMMELEGQSRSLGLQIDDIVENFQAFIEMSAIQKGLAPLLLMACRHHRLPLPPHLWFKSENVIQGKELSEPETLG